MRVFEPASRYFQTLRHLKCGQFTSRLVFKAWRPRPDLRPRPPVSGLRPAAGFGGPPAGGAAPWRGGGRFRFLNEEHEVARAEDWNRIEWGKLWLYNLHYFDFLRQDGIPREAGDGWIARWIRENPPARGNGWEPYPIALRVVNWIKWGLSAGHPLQEEALRSLAVQVRFLRRRLERHLLANHYLADAKALVFAGLFFGGKEAGGWLADGCEIYREQLPEQILPDGGHFERSPMYHCIILEDLLDLCCIRAPLFLRDFIERMLGFLDGMTGPDGGIALFNDAAGGIALPPGRLAGYARELGLGAPAGGGGSRDFPDSGYARLAAGDWTAICDGGDVGPDYQPGHAHADTLSFELWHKRFRLVLDSGTGEYVDTPLRREQRGTAGHNTVLIDGRNSSGVWGAHRVARRAKIVRREFSPGVFIAAHDGYAPVVHEREWRVCADGVRVLDAITGPGTHSAESRWHFPPRSEVTVRGASADVRTEGGAFELSLPEGWACDVVEGRHSPEFGKTVAVPALRCRARGPLPLFCEMTVRAK